MATEGTKFQVNFKLSDGTLINVYATNSAELEAQLATIQDSASLIGAVSGALGNASGVRNAVASLGATSAAPSSVVDDGHCHHGKLVYRTSKPGAAKEWKGWFCPSPQGTPDQCSPRFIR
jgi:hypothetical protein